jgi:hypothetical protein
MLPGWEGLFMTAISAIPLDVAEPSAQAPKKRKSSLKSVLREFDAMSKTMVEQEGLLSPSQAGLILDVSARRVSELMELGKLTRFDFLGRTYVSSLEVKARREMDLKAGRPARGTMAKLKMTLKAVAQMDVPQLAVIATNEPPKSKKK